MNDGAAQTGDSGAAKPRAKRTRTGPLSKREREVFEHLADGLSGAQIAERLVLSPETIRTHIRNGMGKLGASTRSQAVVLALRRGEIAPRRDEAPEGAAVAVGHPPPAGARITREAAIRPLEDLMDGLLALWDVDAGWIYLVDEGGMSLLRAVERISSGAAGLPESIPLGEGALGAAALERRAQIVQAPGAETGAMIVAPLLDGARLVGVLGLAVRRSRATGRQELLLLQALAGRLAQLLAEGRPGIETAVNSALAGFRASWATASPL